MDWYVYTDKAIISKIGDKLKQIRLEQNITQKELAQKSGVSISSVASLEQGSSVSLSTFISILRGLQSFHLIDTFLSEPEISPMAYAKMLDGMKRRQRATSSVSQKDKNESEW